MCYPHRLMNWHTGLLLLLFVWPLYAEPEEPVSRVAGQWKQDIARSPSSKGGVALWRIRITGNRVVWAQDRIQDGEVKPVTKNVYPHGKSAGRSGNGSVWTRNVVASENRLVVQRRSFDKSKGLEDWNLHVFEVKDRGHTLQYTLIYRRGLATRTQTLYFRPVNKEKK